MAAEGGGSTLEDGSNDRVPKVVADFHPSTSNSDISKTPQTKLVIDEGQDIKCRTSPLPESGPTADPEESDSKLCGWLNKCSSIGFVKTAKPLWFMFGDDTCKLYYYRQTQDLLPLGEIDIKHASFYFDVSNKERPGIFEIRSEGKVYLLDAQGQHRMTFWLEELQKKRRLYHLRRKTVNHDKISWTLKSNSAGSGLTGQSKTSDSSKPATNQDLLPSANLSSDNPTGDLSHETLQDGPVNYWSLQNLRTEIRDAVSNIRTQLSNNEKSTFYFYEKTSPPASPHLERKEEWTVIDEEGNSVPQHLTSFPHLPSSSRSQMLGSGSKFGGKLATTFKRFKSNKRSQSEGSSIKEQFQGIKEHGSKKQNNHSSVQLCYKCKLLQDDLLSLREDLRATNEELQANREIVKLLQKELDVMRANMDTRKELAGKGEKDVEMMLRQRDKHIVELEHSMAIQQEEKAILAQQSRLQERDLQTLRDQVAMLQDMLSAKDETVVQLTNQIFEMENANSDVGDDPSQVLKPAPIRQQYFITDTRELETLQDAVRAYQLQNKFLTKEIMELNELRRYDEKREKELLINFANLEALYCQTRSKYLFLLNEKQGPVMGGEEDKTQEAVAQLLQEALETESSTRIEDQTPHHPFFATHSLEYDQYGFQVYYNEEQLDDVLLAKANKLQRQSDEITSRIKDVDEATSRHVKWENFMVGQSAKPLNRSPEVKALIRLGIPFEFKEQIWKGCINIYVGQTRDKLGPLYYKKDLGERIKNIKSNPAAKQIELDLLRTLPNNRHFDSVDSDGIPKLRRVLLSYSVHNPLIGYCQGLNRLAAIALLFLCEEDAFWCLEALIEHIMPKDYYTKTLAAAQADQRVLKELVAEKLPKLYSHLEQNDVDLPLYTFNWFLTIFVDNVRPETFLRIWDVLLFEGSKVLFRFALAFLKYAEEEILTLKEAPHIFRYMRMLGEKITNVKKLTHIAFYEINPFPLRSITTKRLHHIQSVREELIQLDAIRRDFQTSHSQTEAENFVSDDDLDERDADTNQ